MGVKRIFVLLCAIIVIGRCLKMGIGVEYCFSGQAEALATTGGTVAKYYPDLYCWGSMQPTSTSPIDFIFADAFVSEYQEEGFTTLVMTLDSHCTSGPNWGINSTSNYTPTAQYLPLYQTWVQSIVERYDKDGFYDMPGLLFPVQYYEIGDEFSSYEPEDASEYLVMLSAAYEVAHAAYNEVLIAHAAFFVPQVFQENMIQSYDSYSSAYSGQQNYYISQNQPNILNHSFDDLEEILDNGNYFDILNFHSLLFPEEIYAVVDWLNWEQSQRIQNSTLRYPKAIIISDTAVTPFISFGNAENCHALNTGLIFPLAVEEDRCRLGDYFTELMNQNTTYLNWVYQFCAADTVKRVLMAADNNITFIDLAYTEDLYNPFLNPLTSWLFGAGAGNPIWSGLLEDKVILTSPIQERKVESLRPSLFALQRITSFLSEGYEDVIRYVEKNPSGLLYQYSIYFNSSACLHAFWVEPFPILLPNNGTLVVDINIILCFPASSNQLSYYPMINGTIVDIPLVNSTSYFTFSAISNDVQYLFEAF